ncbi:PerC family transcriptional regulator (plasmid) [Escherichia coli]|uniref:PerC family transcriptional regulator n=2 Tax=Escherichia coli TaxID=562 RepID=UPI002649D181|nr:PerC family transcriptional regulator [Escherichia coli]WKB42224.1 PerC family transcriptional regulator [Escherichia coli]
MPVAAGLGAHQPNRRLRLAAEPQTGRWEVSALTDARKTLAYDFFRILRAPHKKAEELEQRGLWRRAAARWQELLLNYLQEDDRICIQRRIQHCLKRAKMKSQRATSPSFWPASQ